MRYSHLAASLTATTLSAAPAAAAASQTDIKAQEQKPEKAYTIPQDFVGFGIESAYFPNYANEFSDNLVNSLADRMKEPPILRVGGTSGDNFLYNPALDVAQDCADKECNNHKANWILGPSAFDGYKDYFKKAKFLIQAPLNNGVNTTNTLAYVKNAWENADNGARVKAIALGNEVEFIYEQNAKNYVKAALDIESSIIDDLGLLGEDANIFEGGNTASGTFDRKHGDTPNDGDYTPDDILKAGLNKDGHLSAMAAHYYQMGTDGPWTDQTMQDKMLSHGAITKRFEMYTPGIEAANDAGLTFAITEDAAVLGGAPTEFAGGFGYALWAVDFNLYAMSKGVGRVSNLAGRPTAKRVFWVPDDTGSPAKPQVRAPYASSILLADFIKSDSGASVQGIDTGNDKLSAYAMYENGDGKLKRVALVNLNLYNANAEGSSRGKQAFKVAVGSDANKVTVRFLHADLGVKAMGYDFGGIENNVTYGGEQWTHAVDNGNGHYPSGQKKESEVDVKDGYVVVEVPDSEAVVVFIE